MGEEIYLNNWDFWIWAILALCIVGLVGFAVGTRWYRSTTGGYCEVNVYWLWSTWVQCVGGENCPDGEHCELLLRMKDTEENWAEAGIVPGGSVKWSKRMEYKCVCRS